MLKYPSPSLGRNPFQNPGSSAIYCLYIVEVYSNIVPILGHNRHNKTIFIKSSRMLTHPATNDSQKNYPNLQFYSISIPATDYTLDSTTSEVTRVLRPGYEILKQAHN